VNPKMRGRLGIIFLERFARPIAPRLHAEKNHAPAIGEKLSGLPGGLVGNLEIEVTQAGTVPVHHCGLALRNEEKTEPAGGLAASSCGRLPAPGAGERS